MRRLQPLPGGTLLSGRLHVSRGSPLTRAGACRTSEGRTILCNSLDSPPVGPPGLQDSGLFPQQLRLDSEHGSCRTETPAPPGPQAAAGLGPAGRVTPMSSFLIPAGVLSSASCPTPWRRATTPAEQTQCGRRSPRAGNGRVAARCPPPAEAAQGWGAVGGAGLLVNCHRKVLEKTRLQSIRRPSDTCSQGALHLPTKPSRLPEKAHQSPWVSQVNGEAAAKHSGTRGGQPDRTSARLWPSPSFSADEDG